jgi:S-DNA-T family DNA segregation ATPase FtsK/SpoIIIE
MSKPSQTKAHPKKTAKTTPAFIRFFQKRETRITLGIVLTGLTAYLTVVLLSYVVTGSSDFSKVNDRGFFQLDDQGEGYRNIGAAMGAWLSDVIINRWFGLPSLFALVFSWFVALRWLGVGKTSLLRVFLRCALGMVWFSLALAFFFTPVYEDTFLLWGGQLGHNMNSWLSASIGWPGTFLLLLASLLIFLLFTRLSKRPFFDRWFSPGRKATPSTTDTSDENPEPPLDGEVPDEFEESWTGRTTGDDKTPAATPSPEPPVSEEPPVAEPIFPSQPLETTIQPAKSPTTDNNLAASDVSFEIRVGNEDAVEDEVDDAFPEAGPNLRSKANEDSYDASYLGEYDPKLDLSSYKYPDIKLLTQYESPETIVNTEEQNSNKRRIQEVLEQFSIRISSITATVGATVTLYEIIPEPGIRISRIKSLENDIALSLAALGIRIIAPIPGKGTIGIEVPNRDPQIVSMRSVLSSKKFQESKYELPMALGRTITNEVFTVDLCKMPHVLVAGATGQGKSVGLNAMITSLLYKKHPAELKFVLVDPKMVEFNIYSAIEKHFLAKLPDDSKAIITDFTKVIQTLNSLTREMDDRYNLLMMANVRNIKEYNTKFVNRHLNPEKGHKFLPYIVVVIDEFGDLIMTAGKEIEMPIARIAQKARAVGIHMIIATQRPTTNIITGTIKANFPARVAFRVISVTDSRTILDASGANQLIGRGDLLFSQGSDLVRVQCAFVDTPEVINVTNYISEQRSYPTAFYLPEPTVDGAGGGNLLSDPGERDPLFEEAARLIVIHQQGSTSLIQRKFSIGYNRAGRIVDQLEMAGIIGPNEGSKARQVLVEDEAQLENLFARMGI